MADAPLAAAPLATVPQLTVAIAGATGFVGRPLIELLRDRFDVVALSRSERQGEPGAPGQGAVTWRRCDLFSLLDTEQALEGCDLAVYLVHSMMPSASLTQGDFRDLDLIAADNFARAAASAGVRHIVYVGGLLPEGGEALSEHLASRLEVEQTLGTYGVPVTTLRAGLVLGPDGSSARMLIDLVRRLPAMICPAWTATPAQPIARRDLLPLIDAVLGEPRHYGETYDVGGADIVTYRDMMAMVAEELGVKRHFVSVPFLSPGLSRLWVSLVTGAPKELVAPLVKSLRHTMLCRDRRLQEQTGLPVTGLREALREAIAHGAARATPRAFTGHRTEEVRAVRSVQRLPLPATRSARWAAEEYLRWLPRLLRPFLRVDQQPPGTCAIRLRGLGTTLLRLELDPDRSPADRPLLYIRGGILAHDEGRGRLEMREVLGGSALLAAIHDFRPRLWWPIYRLTQAQVHVAVMRAFGRHLSNHKASAPKD